MSNLAPGNTGIIAPPNLAANGAFMVDQRQNFKVTDGSYFPAAVGDYLTDMWYVQGSSVDYIEVWAAAMANNYTGPQLALHGQGKKGQQLVIANVDQDDWGMGTWDGSQNLAPITAAVFVSVGSNTLVNNSVPLKISCMPSHHNNASFYNILLEEEKVFKNAEVGQVVTVVDDHLSYRATRERINITLEEDGEFFISIRNYRVFSGAYPHPPLVAPVNYANDLARCQRYYQTSVVSGKQRMAKWNTNVAHLSHPVMFSTAMASNPTITVSASQFNIYTGSGGIDSGIGDLTMTAGNVEPGRFELNTNIDDGVLGPNAYNNGADFDLQWTAEIV